MRNVDLLHYIEVSAPFPFRHKDRQLSIGDVRHQDNQVEFLEFVADGRLNVSNCR